MELVDVLKYLPRNLQFLNLCLSHNDLGTNKDSMKHLAKIYKKFPKNLIDFRLLLSFNALDTSS